MDIDRIVAGLSKWFAHRSAQKAFGSWFRHKQAAAEHAAWASIYWQEYETLAVRARILEGSGDGQ